MCEACLPIQRKGIGFVAPTTDSASCLEEDSTAIWVNCVLNLFIQLRSRFHKKNVKCCI